MFVLLSSRLGHLTGRGGGERSGRTFHRACFGERGLPPVRVRGGVGS